MRFDPFRTLSSLYLQDIINQSEGMLVYPDVSWYPS